MGHFLYYFWDSFFAFHSTYLNMKWLNFWPLVQEKSVQRPHMSPYLDKRWEWFWVQNPLKVSWKLDVAFSWKFTFWVKIEHRALFKILCKIIFFRYIKVCKDKPKIDLLKKFEHFIISSLVTCSLEHSIRFHHWIVHKKSLMSPLNCT